MRSTRCLGPPGPLCCSTVCADAIDAVDPVRAAASVKVLISICLPRRMVIAVSSCERDKTIDGRGRKIWRGFGKDFLIREGSNERQDSLARHARRPGAVLPVQGRAVPPYRLAAFLRRVRGQFVRRRLWRLPRLERAPLRPERELPRDPDRPAGAPSGCPPGKCNLDLCGSLRSPDPAAGRLLPCRWPPPARAVRTVAPSQVRVVPRARRRSQPMQGALCSSPQVTADWSSLAASRATTSLRQRTIRRQERLRLANSAPIFHLPLLTMSPAGWC